MDPLLPGQPERLEDVTFSALRSLEGQVRGWAGWVHGRKGASHEKHPLRLEILAHVLLSLFVGGVGMIKSLLGTRQGTQEPHRETWPPHQAKSGLQDISLWAGRSGGLLRGEATTERKD